MLLAASVLLSSQPLAAQTISNTQTTAVNMTSGNLLITETGFLKVTKNAINLNKAIKSMLTIDIKEGGRISGKRALALDAGMENGITGELIRLNNAGTMTGTENQAIDLRFMLTSSATITNTGTIFASKKGAIKLGNNATVINSGTIETTAFDENGISAKHYDPSDDKITNFARGLHLENSGPNGKIIGMKHGVTGEGSAYIYNSACIEGKGGSGVNWDWDPVLQKNDQYTVTLINEADGIITGTGNSTTLDGDGVDVDYIVDLTNHGQIIAKDSFGSADGLAIGGGRVNNTGSITASNSNRSGQAYGILVDNSDNGNAFESVTITNSGTIAGTGSNGVGIKIVSDKSNLITMNGGLITGGSGKAVIMGSGDDTFAYTSGVISGSIDGGAGRNTMIFNADTAAEINFSSDLYNFSSIHIQSGAVTLKDMEIRLDLASLSQNSPLFSLAENWSTTGNASLEFNQVTLLLTGAFKGTLAIEENGMSYFQLAGDGISLDGLKITTERGYELDLSREGMIGINFNTPEPATATLALLGFSSLLLRRKRSHS